MKDGGRLDSAIEPGGIDLSQALAHRLPRRRLLILAGSASAAAFLRFPTTTAQAQPSASTPLRQTLANGLTVVVDERRAAETLAVQLTARDGSRDDLDQPGISALTSRMMFQ